MQTCGHDDYLRYQFCSTKLVYLTIPERERIVSRCCMKYRKKLFPSAQEKLRKIVTHTRSGFFYIFTPLNKYFCSFTLDRVLLLGLFSSPFLPPFRFDPTKKFAEVMSINNSDRTAQDRNFLSNRSFSIMHISSSVLHMQCPRSGLRE